MAPHSHLCSRRSSTQNFLMAVESLQVSAVMICSMYWLSQWCTNCSHYTDLVWKHRTATHVLLQPGDNVRLLMHVIMRYLVLSHHFQMLIKQGKNIDAFFFFRQNHRMNYWFFLSYWPFKYSKIIAHPYNIKIITTEYQYCYYWTWCVSPYILKCT